MSGSLRHSLDTLVICGISHSTRVHNLILALKHRNTVSEWNLLGDTCDVKHQQKGSKRHADSAGIACNQK